MSVDYEPRVPTIVLEQYRIGELTTGERLRVEEQLGRDLVLRERLAELDRSDAEIAVRYPPDWMANRIRTRRAGHAPQTPSTSRRVALAAALTTAAVVIIGLLDAKEPDGRIKGSPSALAVYRRTAGGNEALADGALARPGDLLRLGYRSPGRRYGVILSIDGRGIVTAHLPPQGATAPALQDGGTVLLDSAYELDDAPAWERFYFVTAGHAFEIAPIVAAAHRAARGRRDPPEVLPLADEFDQSTFLVQKEARP